MPDIVEAWSVGRAECMEEGKPEKDDPKKRTNPQTTPHNPQKKNPHTPTAYRYWSETGRPDAPV